MIHSFVAEAAEARANHQNYLDALVRLAGGLAEANKPKTPRDVLQRALSRMGIAADIGNPVLVKPSSQDEKVMYPVALVEKRILVPLDDSVLETDDPISTTVAAIKEHSASGSIPDTTDQLYHMLGVGEKELDARSIMFDDAEDGGIHRFVYTTQAKAGDPLFLVQSDVKGEKLLMRLEEEIIRWHDSELGEERPLPIPLPVLEAQARRIIPQTYPKDVPHETLDIAIVLDYLIRSTPRISVELVPEQYRAAIVELRELPARHSAHKTEAQVREFWEALDEFEDARASRARKAGTEFAAKHGALKPDELQELVSKHMDTPVPDLDVCADALGDIMKAYSALRNDDSYAGAQADVLASKRAFFVHTIRTEIENLVASKYIVVEK